MPFCATCGAPVEGHSLCHVRNPRGRAAFRPVRSGSAGQHRPGNWGKCAAWKGAAGRIGLPARSVSFGRKHKTKTGNAERQGSA